MERGDGLPQYGCLCCIQKLETVVTFIKQCKESDRVLRKNLDNRDPIQDLKSFSLDYSSDDQNQYSDENDEDFAIDSSEDITNKKVKKTTSERKKIAVKKDAKTTAKNNSSEKATVKIKSDDSEEGDFWAEFDVKPVKSVKSTKVPSGDLCYHCGKEFLPGQRNAYRNHIANYHSEKSFKCDKCHRAFFTQLQLEGHHFNYHQYEGKRFACDMCDRKYESNKRLKNHKESIHLKLVTYECNLCSKVFYNKHYFRVHEKTHTSEGEAKCTYCNKVFCNKAWLNKHMRSHTGERPYSCRFCDSKFHIAQSLREHERLHTGEKPYKCPACQKGFSQNGNMKSHFKYNHRELDFKVTRAAFQLSLKKEKETDKVSGDAVVLEIEYTKQES